MELRELYWRRDNRTTSQGDMSPTGDCYELREMRDLEASESRITWQPQMCIYVRVTSPNFATVTESSSDPPRSRLNFWVEWVHWNDTLNLKDSRYIRE